ncbi:GMC oxidoreductase [Tulasnella calospora MUT 4182]|uniref:GMC oxidoreductase n=1 Tax=Tulasnella calospora MUT 4182 TaxID=1051891 RepID=A0A0C3LJA7_9AGAM|nr:GMC oxidoreductase [Tulasnella calospora MUT 4182]
MCRVSAVVSLLPISCLATPIYEHPWHARRAYVTPEELQPSYDFVIAGGGLAGLVLASRLSEDANTTVLVIEAGPTGDDVRSRIDTPVIAYFNGLMRSQYDWQHITTPQPNLNNRNISWPGGKVLGGSSAMNGMYMVRPSAVELNTMAKVLGDMDGAAAWGWDGMYNAMKMSETFTPPSAEIQSEGNILYNAASHGTSGPIHTTFAGFVLPLFGQWGATLGNLGVDVTSDADSGEGWGAFVSTSAINPSNWTRSYSKSAYIDPLPPRANLHIMTNQTVTRLIFDNSAGTLKATAVEYANNGYQTKPWPTVGVNKEVVVTGGPVGSPNILMQSGVGPADKLKAAGVEVAYALPGVGQHVQDHLSTQVIFRTTAQTTAQLYAAGAINGTSNPIASFVNSAIAYTNITDLLGDYASAFQQEVIANMSASTNDRALNPSSDPTVTKGYQAIYQATVDTMLTPAGQVELLLAMTGTSAGQDTFAVQAGLQHPFSTGELYIATPNPFDYPVINPNYFSHQADVALLREGIKLARKVGQTQPISTFVTAEVSPGPDVQTDEQVDAWLRGVVSTEFHPSCTCAMLPLDQGGVVDAKLKVYGLANVRVADSSVFPLSFAAHLMAPTYGLAEQAAMIIKSQYNGTPSPAALQTATATASSQPTGTSNNDNKPSSGFKLAALPSLPIAFAVVLTFLVPAVLL